MKSKFFLVICLTGFWGKIYSQSSDVAQLPPLDELGTGKFMGRTGGLYPNGRNIMPAEFMADAIMAAQKVQPVNAAGMPDANGKIGLVTIGASTVAMFSDAISENIYQRPGIQEAIVFVNGGVGGQDLNKIYDQQGKYWQTVESRVAQAGLTNEQVQIVWLQEDDLRNTTSSFPDRADMLVEEFIYAIQKLKVRYPNLQIIYLTARHTTDYMPADAKDKHKEPRAYLNGWAMKFLIEEQINGNKELAYKGEKVKAPLLMWGPYFWTQGEKPRSDGYSFTPDMTTPDGVHPNDKGKVKVANDILQFWESDPVSQIWYYGAQAPVAASNSITLLFAGKVIETVERNMVRNTTQVILTKDEAVVFNNTYNVQETDKIEINNLPQGQLKYLWTDGAGFNRAGSVIVEEEGIVIMTTGNSTVELDSNNQKDVSEASSNFTFTINRKNKLPVLARSLGADTYVTVKIRNRSGEVVLEIKDVLHKNTDVNALLERGEYNIKFYDQTGNILNLKKEFPEYVLIK